MKKLSLAIFSAIMLSGCSVTWEPLNNPTLPLQEAKRLCDDTALAQYPVKNEVATRSVEKQITLMCKKDDKDCNSSGYKIEQKLGVESYVMDVNVNSRKTAFLSCMEKNGWKKTSWL
ncbi:MAG: hypothetical protein ACRCUG_01800 [Yersinia sp. (in: enterobacteria)]